MRFIRTFKNCWIILWSGGAFAVACASDCENCEAPSSVENFTDTQAGSSDDAGASGTDSQLNSPDAGGVLESESGSTDVRLSTTEIIEPLSNAVAVTGDRWRGFNFTGKYLLEDSNDGYDERRFQLLRDLGFNHARLPLDYRVYTKPGDWYSILEEGIRGIDQAVAYGQQYGIHVSLNLHRAPGYCIHDEGKGTGAAEWVSIPENQKLDLWKDEEAQAAFVAHWRFFSERYQELSNEYISFNLVNEPKYVSPEKYLEVMQRAIDAIREVTPDRTVVVDGYEAGEEITPEFANLQAVVSKHSYDPKNICFYKVPWWPESMDFPEPAWPPETFLPRYLCGHYKQEEGLNVPIVIRGEFEAGTVLSLHIYQVSMDATLEFQADGTVFNTKVLDPSGATEDWQELIYQDEWDIFQSIYDNDVSGTIRSPARELAIYYPDGDWITISSLSITKPGAEPLVFEATITDWGVPPAIFELTEAGILSPVEIPEGFESSYQVNDGLDDWRTLAATGVPMMVGEFGVYNMTPHDITLAVLEFKLKAFQEIGMGWCMWDIIDPSGIFNSGRADVAYEEYEGLLLDREMLDLLQRY